MKTATEWEDELRKFIGDRTLNLWKHISEIQRDARKELLEQRAEWEKESQERHGKSNRKR